MNRRFWVFCFSLVRANWLHQCSPCVDQALYSDLALKTDIKSVNTSVMYEQMKRLKIREFEHVETEFFNRFFSRSKQLGLVAQELQTVCPEAVSLIPERRYVSANGTQVSSRNILMVRESHVLFMLAASVQELAKRTDVMDSDYWTRVDAWDSSLNVLQSSLGAVSERNKDLSESVTRADGKIGWLSEQWTGLYKAVKIAEDRVGESNGKISVLDSQLTGLRSDLNRVEEKFLDFKTSTVFNLSSLAEGLSAIQSAEETLRRQNMKMSQSLSRRLIAVENKVFELVEFVYSRAPLAEIAEKRKLAEAHVQWVKKMLLVEKKKSESLKFNHKLILNVSAMSAVREAALATRRERFDLELLELEEASRLRVLKAKAELEAEAADKQLKFEREKLDVEMAVRIEQAKIESDMKFRDRRENEDVNLRELTEKNIAEKDRLMAVVRESAEIVLSWIKALYSNPDNLIMGIGSVIVLVTGVFVAKEGAQLTREAISRRLGKPELVRLTSRRLSWNIFSRSLSVDPFKDVVLNPKLMGQIKRLAAATRASRRQKNSPLLNCMFYGEPGTGKTMVAKRFAEFSGLDYAIMSGGDVAPLGAEAVTEIHKLFKWVNGSKKGVVLFIDEAESFLGQRSSGMSENMRNAITAMLFHTGTASSKFMMIIATNRPGDLDSAIVDRIDESIEFPLPDLGERDRMVKMYFKNLVSDTEEESTLVSKKLSWIAQAVSGFSGREISKLMLSVHSHLDTGEAQPHKELSQTLQQVTEAKIVEHKKAREMAKFGYKFDHNSLDTAAVIVHSKTS